MVVYYTPKTAAEDKIETVSGAETPSAAGKAAIERARRNLESLP